MDNLTSHNTTNTTDMFHSLTGVGYIVIGVLGMAGNLTLALAFWKENLVSRGSAVLHVAFALSNAGVVAGFPFTSASAFAGRWLFGAAGCQFYAFEGMFSGISSIILLSVLNVDRFINIHSQQAYGELNVRAYWFAILVSYLTAAFWSTVPIIGWSRYALDKTGVACVVDWEHPTHSYLIYILAVSLACFVLPYSLMAVGFVRTFIARSSTSTNVEKLADRTHDKIVRVLSIMSMITWTPFAILCLQFLVREPSRTSVTMAAMPALIAKAVTALIPLVYVVISPELRYSIKHMYTTSCADRKHS